MYSKNVKIIEIIFSFAMILITIEFLVITRYITIKKPKEYLEQEKPKKPGKIFDNYDSFNIECLESFNFSDDQWYSQSSFGMNNLGYTGSLISECYTGYCTEEREITHQEYYSYCGGDTCGSEIKLGQKLNILRFMIILARVLVIIVNQLLDLVQVQVLVHVLKVVLEIIAIILMSFIFGREKNIKN